MPRPRPLDPETLPDPKLAPRLERHVEQPIDAEARLREQRNRSRRQNQQIPHSHPH